MNLCLVWKVEVVPVRKMKAYGGHGRTAPLILKPVAKWKWVVSFTLLSLYLQERTPVMLVGGWVGPRAGLDVLRKRKPKVPAGIRTPGFPNPILVIIPTSPRHPLDKHRKSNTDIYCISLVLGTTQPQTEMSTKNIFWGVKAAGA